MSDRICGRCKSPVVVPWNDVKDFYKCMNCSAMGYAEKFPEKTLFDRITESPETLAKEFVIKRVNRFGGSSYQAILLKDRYGNYEDFYSYEKAIDATVARLKEVVE